jgi:hypothetical protein
MVPSTNRTPGRSGDKSFYYRELSNTELDVQYISEIRESHFLGTFPVRKDISTRNRVASGYTSRYSGYSEVSPQGESKGNPVKIRSCPAAVSRYKSPR